MSVGNCGDRVSDLPETGVCELTTGDRGKIAGGKEDRRGEKKNRRGEDHQGKSPGNIRREEFLEFRETKVCRSRRFDDWRILGCLDLGVAVMLDCKF